MKVCRHTIDGAGHYGSMENPAAFNMILADFIAGIPAA